MLSPKQNFYEAAKGLNPDRYVNQYEAIRLILHPALFHSPSPAYGEENVKNAWGVTYSYPIGTPGAFPVHNPDTIVIKDIEHWQDYVHAPSLDFPEEEWAMLKGILDKVDDNLAYKTPFVAPGLFEQCHHLGEIHNTMINLYEYEDEMHDLIKYLRDYELGLAEGICKHLKPNALFHHDDWGSRTSTFMSPAMFEDFFVDAYKEIYGYYKSHGCELIIHHSDSYGANIIPEMIEMGIDVWQGPMHTNNVPELVKQYGKQITFMGDIDNKFVDFNTATYEDCVKAARNAIESVGTMEGFIPCITQGGPGSLYIGGYEGLFQAIDEYNIEKFGYTQEEIDNARLPLSVMMPGTYQAHIVTRYNK